MNWILLLNAYLYVSMPFNGGALRESTIENLLTEVDVSLSHRPSEDRVPAFMHLLYGDLKQEMLRSHMTSWEMYARSPVIRSFRARSKDNSGRRFKFEIPSSLKLNDIHDAYLIVNASHVNVTAKYRGRPLERHYASFSNNYYAFNVVEEVITTRNENRSRIHFHFPHTRHMSARDVSLVVYQHIAAQTLDHARRKRNTFQNTSLYFFQSLTQNSIGDVDDRDCRRMEWDVNFDAISWFWIIAPNTVSAGVCRGDCSLLSTNQNTTNYTFMKTMYHIQNNDGAIPHASCVPTLLAPMTIIYYDRQFNVITRIVPEFIVAGCGCR
ncbi:bone morphogenetic protein 4-like [Haliotis rufescens]|uniref:bone morphogenetic protein 4-like n=1 Tax=Haliotis rufescens TaxID=6454 RepID=UPI001EB067C1|nr:bone morphogenetic protein 4-like [Haliotis rufescens]